MDFTRRQPGIVPAKGARADEDSVGFCTQSMHEEPALPA